MILDLTQEEVMWRFGMLKEAMEESIAESVNAPLAPPMCSHVLEIISASVVYLLCSQHISVVLHDENENDEYLFTVDKRHFIESLWEEPDETFAYDRPSKRAIPVPNLFDDEGKESFTKISLAIKYPNSKLGEVCREAIAILRKHIPDDVLVVNYVVFCCKYLDDIDLARYAVRQCLFNAFTEDWMTSSLQTPTEVRELMEIVLETPCKMVYDPFMRTGFNFSFADETYIAQGEDLYHVYAIMLYSSMWGMNVDHVYHESCVNNWKPGDCDTIIATPELSRQIESEPVGSWLLEKLYSSMNKEDRKALAILPANVLGASGKYEILRHDIVEANLLDTVVLLPANLFPRTGVQTTVILLKSGRASNASITFADFSQLVNERDVDLSDYKPELDIEKIKEIVDSKDSSYVKEVSIKDIQAMEYDWYTPVYFNRDAEIPRGYQKVCLKDLMQQIDEFGICPSWINYIVREDSMSSHPFEDNECMELMSMDECKEAGVDDEEYSFTSCDCVFLVDFQGPLKTYCSKKENPFLTDIAFPNGLYAYCINPDVIDPCFLRMILHEKFASIELEDDSKEQILDRYIRIMYSDMIIPISVEEQKRLYEEAKFNHAIEKARKEGLDEAVERMKQEYMMEVRMRKHDMKPFLSQLDSQAKLITFYLDKIEGNEQVVSAIRSKLTGVSNAVSELRLHLNRLTEEDIYGTPEKLNPLEILNEFVGTFDNYSVELDVDTLALEDAGIAIPYISFCPVDFSTLVGTIKENAVAHAFVDEKQKYHFRISFSYDKAKERYIIDFMNDGKPMPQGMDKFRYGLKGEKGARSQGTGLGGYRVKSIARHYGGDYDVFCNRTQGLVTTIRVELPPYKE